MKKESAITVATVLVVSQILSSYHHLHTHAELRIQNTLSDPPIHTSADRFYRYWVPSISPSKNFSTREALIQDAKSHGHLDPIIEIVSQEGMSAHQTLTDCPYPELFYCGIRI